MVIAERIKNFIIWNNPNIFPTYVRFQVIKDFYSCKSESDYKLFASAYNKVILDILE